MFSPPIDYQSLPETERKKPKYSRKHYGLNKDTNQSNEFALLQSELALEKSKIQIMLYRFSKT